MNRLMRAALAASAMAGAATALAADTTITAPGGVGDVVALTNAITNLAQGDRIFLEAGTYDLSSVAMSDDSHLHVAQFKIWIIGLGSDASKTVLQGGGQACGKRVLYMNSNNFEFNCISNLTVTGGWTTKSGGALCGNESYGLTCAYDCVFTGNHAGGNGGAINAGYAERCQFVGNTAGSGGGIFCNKNHGVKDWYRQGAKDCTFTENDVGTGNGGGFCAWGDGVLRNCRFVGNTAGYGGGAFIPGAISGCTFENNISTTCGGGLYMGAYDVSIYDCTFTGNTCSGKTGGGGLYCHGGIVSNCVFTSNMATASDGGGMRLGSNAINAGFKAVDCVFDRNSASGNGGGASAQGGFVGCTFTGNLSGKSGGAAYAENVSLCGPYSNCVFRSNEATGNQGACAVGAKDATIGVTVVDSWMSENQYGNQPALRYVTVRDSVVSNHQSTCWMFMDCNFYGCQVIDNRSTYTGGGVNLDTGHNFCTNANSVFKGNYYGNDTITSGKTVLNCTYVANEACAFNWARIVDADCPTYNTVFLDNILAGERCDFIKRQMARGYPLMTNCTFSACKSDANPLDNPACVGCQKLSKSQLKFKADAAHPYTPSGSSPLTDAGYEAAWMKPVLGDKDVYGRNRKVGDVLDIGAAESARFGMTIMIH